MVVSSGPSLFPSLLYAGEVRIWAFIAGMCTVALLVDVWVVVRRLRQNNAAFLRLALLATMPAVLGITALIFMGHIWMETDQLLRAEAVVHAQDYGILSSGFQLWQEQLQSVIFTLRNENALLCFATLLVIIASLSLSRRTHSETV